MKYYFITNPAAGKKNSCELLSESIRNACEDKGVCYEIYETKCEKDATDYVKLAILCDEKEKLETELLELYELYDE